MTYTFRDVSACNMCGEPADRARTMGIRLNRSQGMLPRRKTGVAVSVCRCRNCGLIFSNPQPIPKSLEEHYGIPAEDYWPKESFNYNPEDFAKCITQVKKLLSFQDGMRALDIGFGLGKEVLSIAGAGFDVYGIEPSAPFYERAIKLHNLSREKFIMTKIEEAELPESCFDFVSCGAVVEHLYDPALALELAMKWTKPGGIIYVEVPHSDYMLSRIYNTYFALMGTNYVTNLSPMHVPFHLFEFTLESFVKHGARSGYLVADHWIDVCTIRHIPKFLQPFLRWRMARNGTGLQLVVFLRKSRTARD
jgi:2-polyprenyl-3-methyl-5-hydroxy-6-metoxy-1,4-benzoquinol methylase